MKTSKYQVGGSFSSALLRNQRRNRWRKRLAALRARAFDFQDRGLGDKFTRVCERIQAWIDNDAPPAELVLSRPVAGKPAPLRFVNNTLADGSKRAQKVLFSGSRDCIAGQLDLFNE